ncbi:MAG: hypothetical protein WCJ35_23450 [Planctomycetota bacterium]
MSSKLPHALSVENLTKDSEEVGNGKLRPEKRVFTKADHANARRRGKIVSNDFASRLHVAVSAVLIAYWNYLSSRKFLQLLGETLALQA